MDRLNMRGFKVTYEGKEYSCIDLMHYNATKVRDGVKYVDVPYLIVSVISPEGRFEVLRDLDFCFAFKEEK